MGFELGLQAWLVLIGGGLAGIGLLVLVVGVPLRALMDVARRTPDEFEAIGEDRRTWLVAMLVATVVLGPGWLAAIVYLRTVRPRLVTAAVVAVVPADA